MAYTAGSWSVIDAIGRPSNLTYKDRCYYYYQYVKSQGFQDEQGLKTPYSFIMNLKKLPSQIRSQPSLGHYKSEAIKIAAQLISGFLQSLYVGQTPLFAGQFRSVLLPIPPSKQESDPDYDNRIFSICKLIERTLPIDVIQPFRVSGNVGSFHSGGSRDVREYCARIIYDRNEVKRLRNNRYDFQFVIDDVITSGCHFAAMKQTALAFSPSSQVVGIFLAKSV